MSTTRLQEMGPCLGSTIGEPDWDIPPAGDNEGRRARQRIGRDLIRELDRKLRTLPQQRPDHDLTENVLRLIESQQPHLKTPTPRRPNGKTSVATQAI